MVSHKKNSLTMQVLLFVIFTFYSKRFLGFCLEISETNVTRADFVTLATSVNMGVEKEIVLQTMQNSIQEDEYQDASKSYENDFSRPVPLISDPLFEGDVWNASSVKGLNLRRNAPERGFTHENKMMLLQLHNLYRSNVTPTAGDMAYMEWDDELARLAQIWSDQCNFTHAMPENNYSDTIGQNLYKGTDPTGYLALYLWFEEQGFYDLRKDYCLPGKQCGHYIQMAWSKSSKLGCGITKCGYFYHITCHYSPQALKGIPMYNVAKPCSQCPSRRGSLCLKNLCMTWKQCKNNPFDCKFAECNLECLNCGRLDKERCVCECADGWDSADCSYLCTDKHPRCGLTEKGFPKAYCYKNDMISERYCRKMCGKCNAVNISISNDTCCGGMLCEDGFVLDVHENSCKCKLLCPGPLCDGDEEIEFHQAALSRSNAIYWNSFFIMSLLVSALCHKNTLTTF